MVAGSVSPGESVWHRRGGVGALAVVGKPLLEGCSSVAFASSCAATMVPFPRALPRAGPGCHFPVPSLLLPSRLSLVNLHKGFSWGGWARCQGFLLFPHGQLVVAQVSWGMVATTMAC